MWWKPLHRSAIMLTNGECHFINRRSCWSFHTYGDHRLRAWRSSFRRPAIMLSLYNFSNLRLHTYGEHCFFDRRSCSQNAASSTGDHVDLCIPSATTDCAHMEIAGDHVDLYIRRQPTTYAWRSSFHRPTIMLTLYIFDDHQLHTYRERRFIDRRSCWPFHTFVDHRLRTHGDRRFMNRRSPKPANRDSTVR